MAYCTQDDLITRYGEEELIQLTDATGAGVINADTVARAIADAAGEIDGYLAGRYSVPLSPVPKSIERIACDIARYYLYADQITEAVKKRYDDAVLFLRGIARGDIHVGVDDAGAAPVSDNGAVMQSGGNVFTRKDRSFI